MTFASPGFLPFLLSVYFLYQLLSSPAEGTALRWLQALAALFFADVIWLLMAPGPENLWDPVGGIFFSIFVKVPLTAAQFPSYMAGATAFAASLWLGERNGALDSKGSVLRAGASAGAIVLLGFGVWAAHRFGTLDLLTERIASVAHLGWLVCWGYALGASRNASAQVFAKQLSLFLVSAALYHSWAVTTWGAYRYLLALILGTVVLDYFLARWISDEEHPQKRRSLLVWSFIANLGILAFFKYFDFFGRSAQSVLRAVGSSWEFVPFALLLPAGISFHTFQSLSYTVDVQRKKLTPTPSVLEFATFVLFFPQLVAGPIVRAEEFLPQIANPPTPTERAASLGLLRIARGLIKKLAFADPLAVFLVDRVFDRPSAFSGFENLLAVYGYAMQIYLDFSAYSDIAIGAAALLGFHLPENFRTPYRSVELSEFWRRWHITLSSWLRDYLYIPLGGSRGSNARTYRNLLLTMLLGGLWHGASWAFVFWGALHGGGLAITRALQRYWERNTEPSARRWSVLMLFGVALLGLLLHAFVGPLLRWISQRAGLELWWIHLLLAWIYLAPLWAACTAWAGANNSWVGRVFGMLLTFHYVCFAWIFFRAPTFDTARAVLQQLGTFTVDAVNIPAWFYPALAGSMLSHLVPDPVYDSLAERFVYAPWWVRSFVLLGIFAALRALALPSTVQFIYFQF